jgi:hypothetical protein
MNKTKKNVIQLFSKNKKKEVIPIFTGLTLYRTAQSKYYFARIYVGNRRYQCVSTKETTRIEAKKVAEELFFKKKNDGEINTTPQNKTFKHFANLYLQDAIRKSGVARSERFGKDVKKLITQKDGISSFFGSVEIKEVSTALMREYIEYLNSARPSPLSFSTLNKHLNVIKQILKTAFEERCITEIPIVPELKRHKRNNPRASFDDDEYKLYLKTTREIIDNKVEVKGRPITKHDYYLPLFLVHTFQRPILTELYANKISDITIKDNPKRLEIKVFDGKTGYRTVHTMPQAVDFFIKLKEMYDYKKDDYLFYPYYKSNRETAVRRFQMIFNLVAENCNLKNVNGLVDVFGNPLKRTPYAFRHYGIQLRLRNSKGKINITTFARNCGTTTAMFEKFYLKNMELDKDLIRNLQTY